MKVLRTGKNDRHFKFSKPWQKYAFLFPEEKNIKFSAVNKRQYALIPSLNFTAQLFPVPPCQQASNNSNQTEQMEAEKNIKEKQLFTSAMSFAILLIGNEINVFIIIILTWYWIAVYCIVTASPVTKLS